MAPGELTDTTRGRGSSSRSWARLDPDAWAAGLARRERTLWALVVLATLADLVTTLAGLRVGLAEGNPLVAGILEDGGLAGFLGVKAGALALAAAVRLALPRFRVAIPLGLAVPWAVAASVNVLLIAALA